MAFGKKKYAFVGAVGIMMHRKKTKEYTDSDGYLKHMLRDITLMSDDTLRMIVMQKNNKNIALAARAELFMRDSPLSWIAPPMTYSQDDDNMEPVTHLHLEVDDDFTPFGEDGSIPKSLQRKQKRYMHYFDQI